MQFRNVTLATLLTSATAMGAFAADPDRGEGNTYEDAAEVSGQYIHDGDSYSVEGKTYSNVGGETRSEANIIPDEGHDPTQSHAEKTLAENIIAAADQGTPVSTSDDIVVGNVAYTQEMSNGYRIFVSVEDAQDVGAEMIGFSAEVLEVKSVGEGLEYSATLEDLREHVADKKG